MIDNFSKTVRDFLVEDPFYGTMLSNMQREYSKDVEDITFTLSGINIKVLVNPDFVTKHNENQIFNILRCELNHLLQRHFTEDVEKNAVDFKDKDLANISFDLASNENYISSKASQLPTKQVPRWYYLHLINPDYVDPNRPGDESLRSTNPALASTIDNMYKVNAEYDKEIAAYTEKLDQLESQREYDEDDDLIYNEKLETAIEFYENKIGELEGKKISWSDILDVDIRPHLIWDEIQEMFLHTYDHNRDDYGKATPEDFITTVTLIQEQVDFNMMACYKSCGRCPGFCQEYINSLLAPKKAAYDWRKAFRRMLGNSYTDNFRSSRMKYSNRFDDAAGFKHVKNSKILVAVDTSGSVSPEELADFSNEIHNIWKSGADITIAEGDTSIANIYPYTGNKITKFVGRGGTNFAAMVDYWNEHCREYDGFVFMTDGEDSVRDLAPIRPMIWVISAGGYQEKVYPGKTIFIPKE